jgi:outer membrane protein TolC
VDEAAAKAAEVEARATRREAEAQTNTLALRQRVAEQVSAAQREAEEARRDARNAATRLVADARREADDLRREAREALERARAEVATLTTRRDEIAGELGRLSGVIEALSVPTPGRAPVDRPADRSTGADVPR